ncbi:alkaline phosphatase D family protein [Wenyingzhuangia sp. 2_MG-2023]|uniref:alkaline phosphatase D family protein n=1 Tax=Wenyingzhuangia sp. 2_MG-2023 TaxID=3062639 RepID=UPI0026E1F364|nr:alkaline phosphatase D family protein [Wenyingzhuangia sp. 2_MG-2023]MDO6739116.1 alkaline phosphatase D family protein [Wenyingzhuangia sp. 2_MG-2023]
MKNIFLILISVFLLSCKSNENKATTLVSSTNKTETSSDFTITFGSCNKPSKENFLWDDVLKLNPDVWIWGGDNIYGDSQDMNKIKLDYELQHQQNGYAEVVKNTKVIGTWDDHDFGKNDAGVEFPKKKESQQLMLDFFGVPKDSPRRTQEGVYASEMFTTDKGSVKVVLLDTRYFRTGISKADKLGEQVGRTILGEEQWNWLNLELKNSTANFNVVMSSIQVIPAEHPYEKWGNFPNERERLFGVIAGSKAKNVIILSGDRHISEFSKIDVESINYPLIDFTSSGLTHASKNFTKEYNPLRVGKVVHTNSFGVLKFNFDEKKVTMQMRGDHDKIQQEIIQVYP